MTPRLSAALLAALALAPLAAPASAQVVAEAPLPARYLCTLYDHGDHAEPGPALDLSAVEEARRGVAYDQVTSGGGRAAVFKVDYSSRFTPQARAAFQKAVDIWSNHLMSSDTIRVKADFEPLETNVLGQAGPTVIFALPDSEGKVSWFVPALANTLVEGDLSGSRKIRDIQATFSSSFSRFYFGLDGNPPPREIDFVSVVLHELGHGLGFIGSGIVDDGVGVREDIECTGEAGIGCVGIQANDGSVFPLIFDRFLSNGVFQSITESSFYPNNSRPLGDLFQSQDLFVNAPTVARVYGGLSPVWAPATFEPGSSFSHWDEIVIRNSSAALMTPALASGEAYQDPGDITCAFFADMGWTLGAGCQTLGVASEPALLASGVALDLAGPNPTRGATRLRLSQPAPGDVRITLHDALGRQLATLLDGPAQTTEDLALSAAGLAPGVYHVVARTEEGTVTRALTVVR